MILCDTNILIELYKNNANVTHALRSVGPENLAISVVTQAEMYFGALDRAEMQQIKKSSFSNGYFACFCCDI